MSSRARTLKLNNRGATCPRGPMLRHCCASAMRHKAQTGAYDGPGMGTSGVTCKHGTAATRTHHALWRQVPCCTQLLSVARPPDVRYCCVRPSQGPFLPSHCALTTSISNHHELGAQVCAMEIALSVQHLRCVRITRPARTHACRNCRSRMNGYVRWRSPDRK